MHVRGWLLIVVVSVLHAQTQEPPTFRVGTQLGEISVVAQDKQGKPVGDLTKEEFRLFDNGVLREIRLFIPEGSLDTALPTRTPNVFTNLASPSGGLRSGYTIILFDNLFTEFGDPFTEDGTAFGVQSVLRAVRNLSQGEKVAIYAVGRKLKIVREFTTDLESVERELRSWKPSPDDARAGTGECFSIPNPDVAADCVRVDSLERAPSFEQALAQVADHVSGIPGRKNLIFMANRFPVSARSLQKLSSAGIAIYPVDEAGVKSRANRQQMLAMAAMTGGVAYFGRNDVDIAVREAIEDGRAGYTLGYYRAEDDTAQRARSVAVSVTRQNVTLRYRGVYQGPARAPMAVASKANLLQVLNNPVDMPEIPIQAAISYSGDHLNLEARLDPATLGLVSGDSLWKGKLEIVESFTAADGAMAGEGILRHMTLRLRQATYDSALRTGLPYRQELTVPAKAVELKLLFANREAGKVGTLSIPLAAHPTKTSRP